MCPRCRHSWPNVKTAVNALSFTKPAALYRAATQEESQPRLAVARPAGDRSPLATAAGRSRSKTRETPRKSSFLHLETVDVRGGSLAGCPIPELYRGGVRGGGGGGGKHAGRDNSKKMPSRATTAYLTSAACLAATCLLDTGTAFMLVPKTANTNNAGLRSHGHTSSVNKPPLDGVGFGEVPTLPRNSGYATRLPRVPSAMDHEETSRARWSPLRLHDVFGKEEVGLWCEPRNYDVVWATYDTVIAHSLASPRNSFRQIHCTERSFSVS